MIVSLDVGEMQEACRALSRLIELTADKASPLVVDEDVLDRLVNAVTRAPPSFEDSVAENTNQAQNPNKGHGLYRSVLQLLKGTILPRMSSPRIFRAYARLLSWRKEWEDAIKAYLDAYRCDAGQTTHESETELEKWRAAVGNVEEIVDILVLKLMVISGDCKRVVPYGHSLADHEILRTSQTGESKVIARRTVQG